jgi:hypothetical protein
MNHLIIRPNTINAFDFDLGAVLRRCPDRLPSHVYTLLNQVTLRTLSAFLIWTRPSREGQKSIPGSVPALGTGEVGGLASDPAAYSGSLPPQATVQHLVLPLGPFFRLAPPRCSRTGRDVLHHTHQYRPPVLWVTVPGNFYAGTTRRVLLRSARAQRCVFRGRPHRVMTLLAQGREMQKIQLTIDTRFALANDPQRLSMPREYGFDLALRVQWRTNDLRGLAAAYSWRLALTQ